MPVTSLSVSVATEELARRLRERLRGSGRGAGVVWQQDSDRVVLFPDAVLARAVDGWLICNVDAQTDQTGRQTLRFLYYLGKRGEDDGTKASATINAATTPQARWPIVGGETSSGCCGTASSMQSRPRWRRAGCSGGQPVQLTGFHVSGRRGPRRHPGREGLSDPELKALVSLATLTGILRPDTGEVNWMWFGAPAGEVEKSIPENRDHFGSFLAALLDVPPGQLKFGPVGRHVEVRRCAVHATEVVVDGSDGFRNSPSALLVLQDFEVVSEAVNGSAAHPGLLTVTCVARRAPASHLRPRRCRPVGIRRLPGPVVLISSRRLLRSDLKDAPVAGLVAKEEISDETLLPFVDAAP